MSTRVRSSDAPTTEAQMNLMFGRRRDTPNGKWRERSLTFDDFAALLLNHEVGDKDGRCFLQGTSAEGSRKSNAMIRQYVLGVDLDSGTPLSDLTAAIKREGLEAVVYSTHSHLSDTSNVQRDHFFKSSGAREIDLERLRQYLIETKGLLPEIVENLSIVDEARHTADGVVIVVQHNPIPKFRAVFPLCEPFVFAARGGSLPDAIAEWKERYAGFCTKLKVMYDEKCVDPARLFYLPRHKAGAQFETLHIEGDALNLDHYDRVRIKRNKRGVSRDENTSRRFITNSGFDLKAWAFRSAKLFEVQTMLENVIGGDFIRSGRSSGKPGVHIQCPFEAEHSTFGGEGTFVVNASDSYDEGNEGGFVINCQHNACSQRDRLDYVRELMDQNLISKEDLANEDYLIEIESDGEEGRTSKEPTPVKARRREAETIEEHLEEIDAKYALVMHGKNVMFLREPDTADEDFVLLNQAGFSLLEQHRIVYEQTGRTGSRKVYAHKEWMESPQKRVFHGITFAPGRDTGKLYNSFTGWPIAPKEGDWGMLRDHIRDNVCDGDAENFQYFLTYLASIFQRPNEKPGVAMVITGKKGTGKTRVFDYVRLLLGRYSTKVTHSSGLTGQFNAHQDSKLLLVADEAFWAGDIRAEGVLKDLITGDSLQIERKGVDPVEAPNLMRIVMLSNEDWVVPASFGDERRYFVLKCGESRRGDFAFFSAMHEQMMSGGLEAMMHDLMRHEPALGWKSLRNPPATRHLAKQQRETLRGIPAFMYGLLQDGIYEFRDDAHEAICLNDRAKTYVLGTALRAAVDDFLLHGFQADKAKNDFPTLERYVQEWFGAWCDHREVPGYTNRKRFYVFPPLVEARARAESQMGITVAAPSILAEEHVDTGKVVPFTNRRSSRA